MNILACVKRVPLTGGRIVLTDDERAISTRHLGFTVSPHEECACEEAVRLVEQHGGSSTVLTLGPPEAEEQLRDMMAIGVERAIHLVSDGSESDPQATAAAIVSAVREQGFDLLMFGNESADAGNYQVAVRVAYALGLPVVTGVKAIAVLDGGAAVRCEQEVPGGRDVYTVPLPAVVTVKEGINLPRYPSVPGRLRAKRKPVESTVAGPVDARLEMVRLRLPSGAEKQTQVLGHGADAAPAVISVLAELGLV
ncbi:MAG: electron transfer flavoprotein subunit beta/FixA family protein [Solirubrobacterales bacterium]|nr:electron transfer flavoprotein subunit beta/FixA family protein [Solirubrobacterales bacterium]MBV9715738.1 electron transfer flavoprotein subunit beta/FixA family protein [Solirubrobacterales bacterium]